MLEPLRAFRRSAFGTAPSSGFRAGIVAVPVFWRARLPVLGPAARRELALQAPGHC